MITEFTCGIFNIRYYGDYLTWDLLVNERIIGVISQDGTWLRLIKLTQILDDSMLIEIAVLMNNIKRQYKQLKHA